MEVITDEVPDNKMDMDEEHRISEPEENIKEHVNLEGLSLKDNMPMDVDDIIVSSPKEKKVPNDSYKIIVKKWVSQDFC